MALKRSRTHESDYFVCPHCGGEVDVAARVCPHCGSDDRTGWAEDADKWAADLPTGYAKDGEFDYEDFVRREFPGRARRRPPLAVAAILGAVLLVLLLLLLAR
ncbi:MAG: hypothetical protein KAX44_04660 [Candidatus Brocadiae bacterium]|nr:hypothetical protein [Candidatus Brocadiia bacterium]